MSKIARIPVSSLPPGVPGFVLWVKHTHPEIYNRLASRLAANNQLQGMGIILPGSDPVAQVAASGTPGVAQTILSTVTDLIKVGLPLYQQNQLFNLQIKRAQQGLVPLDTAAIADGSALRVGLDSGTKNTGLIIGGTIAGGLLLFALLRNRRG